MYQQQQQEEKLPFITQALWAYDKKCCFVFGQQVIFGGYKRYVFGGKNCFFGG